MRDKINSEPKTIVIIEEEISYASFLSFSRYLEKTGIKEADRAPTTNSWKTVSGRREATKNASYCSFEK